MPKKELPNLAARRAQRKAEVIEEIAALDPLTSQKFPAPSEQAAGRDRLRRASCTYAAAILAGDRDVIQAAWKKLEDAAIPFTENHRAR